MLRPATSSRAREGKYSSKSGRRRRGGRHGHLLRPRILLGRVCGPHRLLRRASCGRRGHRYKKHIDISYRLPPKGVLGLEPAFFLFGEDHDTSCRSSLGGAGLNSEEPESARDSEQNTWRDSPLEDISSWITDGRLRLGAKCKVLQRGVLRTNCIDCLDRTNIAQFVHAKQSLPLQCRALGVDLTAVGLNHVLQMVSDLWSQHGNYLAIQYGGSGAMHSLALENPKDQPSHIVKNGSTVEVDVDKDSKSVLVVTLGSGGASVESTSLSQSHSSSPFSSTASLTDKASKAAVQVTKVANKAHDAHGREPQVVKRCWSSEDPLTLTCRFPYSSLLGALKTGWWQ